MKPWRVIAAVILLHSLAVAQSITGTLTGTVRDSSAAPVSNVEVSLRNLSTGLTYQTRSNENGDYEFSSLPPGMYAATAEFAGFQKTVVNGISLSANRTVRAEFNLQPGAVTESVQVSASVQVVSTDDSSLGTIVENVLIENVPLNGRTMDRLLRVAAGVTSDSPSNPRIAGSAYWGGTKFSVDGISYNDSANGGAAYTGSHGLATLPSVDSIAEFKVDSTNQKAEYEGSASVTVVTKSGTNQLHGTLFAQNRNKAYAARSASATSLPKPPFNRNEFGGTVGGPVIKNRTFFFGYYEGLRERSPRTNLLSVATANERNGVFTGLSAIRDPSSAAPFPGNIIPVQRLDARTKALLNFVPLPNLRGIGAAGTLQNLVVNVPQIYGIDRLGGRIDHRLSSHDSLSFVYTRSKGDPYYFANAYPAEYGHRGNGGFLASNATLSYTRVLAPATTNEFRAAYFHHVRDVWGTNQEYDPSKLFPDLFPQPAGGLPSMSITGHVGIGDYGGGTGSFYTTQFVDNLTHIRGKHTLKVGFDIVVDRGSRPPFTFGLGSGTAGDAGLGLFTFDGRYTTTVANPLAEHGFADFFLGLPMRTQRATSSAVNLYYQTRYSVFVQDDWKVTPRLTLNMGMRYMLQTPWKERDDAMANLDLSTSKLFVPGAAFPRQSVPRLIKDYDVRAGGPQYHVQMDSNNFAPRLGFAYRLSGDGRTVLRGGAGLFYNTIPLNVGGLRLGFVNPPFVLSETFDAAPGSTPSLTLARPFTASGAITSSPVITAQDPNFVNSLSQQWNFTLEREVARNLAVRVSYVGNKVTHLNWYNYNLNLPREQSPGSVQPLRPWQPWGTINYSASGGDSSFHGLQLEASRRFTNGLSFEANYGWNRALDNVPLSTSPQNPYRADLDRGNGEGVRRHVLTMAYTYEMPFGPGKRFLNRKGILGGVVGGWQISSITLMHKGVPQSVIFNATLSGWQGGRADLIGNPQLPSSERDDSHWFNTAAFRTPAPYQYGNSARNLIYSPGAMWFDVGAHKEFHIVERMRLQFRAESFNFPNHRNRGAPNVNLSSATFGKISGSGEPRQVQFGAKLLF